MSFVLVQLISAGTDTGPFNLYSNSDGFVSTFESNIPKLSLLSGIVVEVPIGTVVVRISSANPECSNYIDVPILQFTTTTTSTTAEPTTTTTSTTLFPPSTTTTTTTMAACDLCEFSFS